MSSADTLYVGNLYLRQQHSAGGWTTQWIACVAGRARVPLNFARVSRRCKI